MLTIFAFSLKIKIYNNLQQFNVQLQIKFPKLASVAFILLLQVRQQAPVRQAARIPPRPQYSEDEDRLQRRRKPQVQILRKYRTDNEDGSITWGFENDDGTFKEENLGSDCITRGKYGYIDPDGVRREYKYETGNRCPDGREALPDELPEEPTGPKISPRRPY